MLSASFVAVLVLGFKFSQALLQSPCPDLFHYDSIDEAAGQWSATLKVQSDVDLFGTWIRLSFDGNLIEITVDFDELEVIDRGPGQFLLKNKDIFLLENVPKTFRINVKYEGHQVPQLVEYRLNGRVLCPPKQIASSPQEFFSGDINNEDFLDSILSNNNHKTNVNNNNGDEFVGCGTAPLNQIAKDSQSSQRGQWPWQAAIHIAHKEQYICEATLVSAKHLLTAAHCVTYENSDEVVDRKKLLIHFNQVNIDNDESNVYKMEVEKITLYPGYSPKNLLANDLAVIELVEPVVVTDYIRPICLTPNEQQQEHSGEDQEIDGGFIVGYGIERNRTFGNLGEAFVKIVNAKECNLNQRAELLTDNTICAKFQGNSKCVGDSGSMLTVQRQGPKPVWELRGVVIAGPALQDQYCDQGANAVILDIANYSKWIQRTIY